MQNHKLPCPALARRGLPSTGRTAFRFGTVSWLTLIPALLLGHATAQAALRFANVFGNNMVLQREHAVRVWGEASPGASILVKLGEQQSSTQCATNGTWETTIPAVPMGGPYVLSATGDGAVVTLTNILCGDVWLCSGQSNMQLPVKEAAPAEQRTVLVNRPNFRLCSVGKTPSAKPLTSADIRWSTWTPDAVKDFSAVACFFATELSRDPALMNVPLGLVDSSFGGTTCEGWIPQEALARFAPRDLHDSLFGIKPANLYNGMIAPLGKTAFKGVLWYQGESNSAHPATYPALLSTMVAEWRRQFEEQELPFLIVQLPEYANLWEGFYWPWIREMQDKASRLISNATLVVTLGTTDGFNLHPEEKLEIGRRASLQARKLAYGEKLVASGPVFKDAQVEGHAIRATFDTEGHGLASTSTNGPTGFELAGSDGEYRFADARLDGESVIVSSDQVPRPRAVRYAWGAVPQAGLINRSGLPAAPFRTDRLPYMNVEIQKQRPARRVATSTYEVIIDADGKVTSLLFQGAQFLSNEPGAAGGSSIPGFWGPRALTTIREAGPRLLSCADPEVTLRMRFEEKALQWGLTNGGKDAITFQLALSPQVKSAESPDHAGVTLTRGTTTLNVEGFDSITNTPGGALLLSRLKPGTARSFSFK